MNGEGTTTFVESSYSTQLRVQSYSSIIIQHKNCPSSAFDDRPGIDLCRVLKRPPVS